MREINDQLSDCQLLKTLLCHRVLCQFRDPCSNYDHVFLVGGKKDFV